MSPRGRPATSLAPRFRLIVAGAVVAMAAAGGCGLDTGLDGDGESGVDGAPIGGSGDAEEPETGSVTPGPPVEVVRLSDGDSGWFLVDGEEIEIRLDGYNAPERFEGDGGPESCNGQAAQTALAELLAGASEVALVDDPASAGTPVEDRTDRFGRLLTDLSVDGVSVVDLLIDGGWGLALGDDRFRRGLMEGAAASGAGMWGAGCGRPAADGLVVDRVEPDPAGRDEENLNGEFVELVNEGTEAVDLTGWDIRDDSSSHRFDLVGSLAPGQRLIVRTGSGSSNQGELFLGSRSPVWSNRGDTVLVIDPAGVIAAWAFVEGR